MEGRDYQYGTKQQNTDAECTQTVPVAPETEFKNRVFAAAIEAVK